MMSPKFQNLSVGGFSVLNFGIERLNKKLASAIDNLTVTFRSNFDKIHKSIIQRKITQTYQTMQNDPELAISNEPSIEYTSRENLRLNDTIPVSYSNTKLGQKVVSQGQIQTQQQSDASFDHKKSNQRCYSDLNGYDE